MNADFKSVDEYIKSFPAEVRPLLANIRSIITKNASEAVECISYGMPAYKLNGKPLVYFAAFKNHIGFYATPTGLEAFVKELSGYKQGKGSVQFPLKDAIPYELIQHIVAFKVKENKQKD